MARDRASGPVAADAPSRAQERAHAFFWALTARPRTVLVASLLATAALASFLPALIKTTSNKAYVPQEGGSLEALHRVEEIFGLGEPVIVLVLHDGPHGVFNPDTLNLVAWLTDGIRKLPGVGFDGVTSLASLSNIEGGEDEIVIEPFYERVASQAEADRVREAALDFELYVDSIVTRDRRATALITELVDPSFGQDVYSRIQDLIARAPVNGEQLHVAGVGAYNALVGDYIDSDATRLNPIAGVLVAAILLLAYRTVLGVVVPLLVALGALACAVGAMAASGVPFFGITTTMTVILIAVGVCDGIHIMGQYYKELSLRPDALPRDLAVDSMVAMWRPVTITSVTSAIGFLALGAASDMRPMEAYGVFAAVGVSAALLLSIFAIPTALALLRPRPSSAYPPGGLRSDGTDLFGAAMRALGSLVHRRAPWVLAVSLLAAVVCTYGALQVRLDNDTSHFFERTEPLHIAEKRINEYIGGTMSLDVVIDTGEPEGLFEPARLRLIERTQRFVEGYPHVRSTMSIADFVKQMNRAMHADQETAYRIPDDPDLIAQYFLLYAAQGSDQELEKYADYEYQLANIRANMDTTLWSVARSMVPDVRRFVREDLESNGLGVELAGWTNISYFFDAEVARSQWLGIVFAGCAIWLTALLCFRSVAAATLSFLPVALAVLAMYGVMGFTGIWLNIATSMISAIAIGLTVDFAVHTLDRLNDLVHRQRLSLAEAFPQLFEVTARSLLFNFAAVLFGFGVLVTSYAPALREFGILIAACVLTAFVSSVTVLPALVRIAPAGLLRALAPSARPAGPRVRGGA